MIVNFQLLMLVIVFFYFTWLFVYGYVSVNDLLKKSTFGFTNFPVLGLFFLYSTDFVLAIFFILITVGLICSSFPSFLRLKLWFKIFFYFLMWVFSAIDFTLRTTLTASHKVHIYLFMQFKILFFFLLFYIFYFF